MKKLGVEDLRNLVGRHEQCLSVYIPLCGNRQYDYEKIRQVMSNAFTQARALFPEAAHIFATPPIDEIMAARVTSDDDTSVRKSEWKSIAYYKSGSTEGYFLHLHPVPELIVVANSFHLKPMFELLQDDAQYNLIELSTDEVTLFRGSVQGLIRIKSFQAIGKKVDTKDIKHEKPKLIPITRFGASAIKPKNDKHAIMKFYRDSDQVIRRFYSASDTPTILAGPRALIRLFIAANKFRTPFLKTIETDDENCADKSVYHRMATEALGNYNRRRALKGVFEFKFAKKFGRAADSIAQVAKAAANGEVKSLLIRGGVNLWGHIDKLTGKVKLQTPTQAVASDDILDDIGELVLNRGGEVHIMNSHEMPTSSPVAAVLTAASA